MEIIFDEANVAASGDQKSEGNMPEELIARHKEKLTALGAFMGAEKVEYEDLDKRERYVISKGKEVLTLTVNGNGSDGGWMNISIGTTDN